MGTLWQDLRFAGRMLAKNPGFAAVAVLSLALGIGGNTAIFSAVNAVILNALPQRDPERLVQIRSFNKEHGAGYRIGVNPITWQELQQMKTLFADLVVYANEGLEWKGEDFVEQVFGCSVSTNFFNFWNTRPVLGRAFTLEEGKAAGPPVIILSHEFWQSHCGGRPDIVGHAIQFADKAFTVIGVMPPHMWLPDRGLQFWLPFEGPQIRPSQQDLNYWACDYGVAARLQPGVTLTHVQNVLDAIARRQLRDYAQGGQGCTIEARPLRYLFSTQKVQRTLLSLFLAAGFVLLIACANIANLLLARSEARQQEMALRAALGASRYRLARQLLTESVLLAAFGGVSGLLLNWWGSELLESLVPWDVPLMKPIGFDLSVLAFTLVVSLVVGVVVGCIPAWLAGRKRLAGSLPETTRLARVSVAARLVCRSLVVSEVTLAVVLMAGAGLMINSVIRLLHVDPGFDPTNLLRVYAQPPREESHQLTLQMLERFAALPGVQAVGVWTHHLAPVECLPDGHDQPVSLKICETGVGVTDPFRAMRVPLLTGRYFEPSDVGEGRTTIIVNQALAQLCWPSEHAVGKRLRVAEPDGTVFDVVGVVGDVRQARYDRPAMPTYYRPAQEFGGDTTHFLLVRTRHDPSSLIPILRREMKALSRWMKAPTFEIVTQFLYDSTAQNRAYMSYLSCAAAVGLLLSAIGVYGVLAWTVSRRTNEIGIRMALGARPAKILGMVLRDGLMTIFTGFVLGIAGALALTRVISGLLYEVSPTDPVTFAVVALFLIAVSLLASYIPARRAAKIDPMEALRYE